MIEVVAISMDILNYFDVISTWLLVLLVFLFSNSLETHISTITF